MSNFHVKNLNMLDIRVGIVQPENHIDINVRDTLYFYVQNTRKRRE